MDIANEFRTPASMFENDLAIMKGLELGAMADTHNGRFLELTGQELHQFLLA